MTKQKTKDIMKYIELVNYLKENDKELYNIYLNASKKLMGNNYDNKEGSIILQKTTDFFLSGIILAKATIDMQKKNSQAGEINSNKILEIIRNNKGINISQVTKITGLAYQNVFAHIGRLERVGLISKKKQNKGIVGREVRLYIKNEKKK